MADATGSALKEFWSFAKDFKSATAWIAKAAVAAPLADILLNIGPPWPSRIALAILVSVVEVLVLMYSFEFWRQGSPRLYSVRSAMQYGIALFAVALIGYLLLFSSFVVEVQHAWDRDVIGYELQPEVKELVKANPSKWTAKELILHFHEPTAIWTSASVNRIRVVLLITWLSVWTAFSLVIGAFVALQWRRMPALKRPPKSKSAPRKKKSLAGRSGAE